MVDSKAATEAVVKAVTEAGHKEVMVDPHKVTTVKATADHQAHHHKSHHHGLQNGYASLLKMTWLETHTSTGRPRQSLDLH